MPIAIAAHPPATFDRPPATSAPLAGVRQAAYASAEGAAIPEPPPTIAAGPKTPAEAEPGQAKRPESDLHPPGPAPTSGYPPGAPGRPWREDDPPMPKGVYAVTKFEGELVAAAWSKHLIVRTCGLYARPSHATGRNFVKTILRLARTQPKLRVVDDQHCTPTYVPHVARAIVYLLGTNGATPAPWGIYNVTNRGETTWCGFAREIVRRAGLDVPVEPITTADFAALAPRPAYSVLDTTAYHRLGGPAMPHWKEALAEYFEELKQYQPEA